ncbi:MAG: hypothetical protein JJT94_05420 [Bernardetiaceae bacterium]|nr:hypothetical protein [Bernardetiaceae bacterium]
MKYLIAFFVCIGWVFTAQAQNEQPKKTATPKANEVTLSRYSQSDSNKIQLKKDSPEVGTGRIQLDNPVVVVTEKKEDKKTENTSDKKAKKDEPNAFQKAIAEHHDQNIKNFVKGEAYLLTGRTAEYAKEDSLIFKDFQYAQKLNLKDSLLADIGKVLSDTSHFAARDYEFLGVFAPKLGLKLTDSKGNTSYYVFAMDVRQAQADDKKVPVSQKATHYFDSLADAIFKSHTTQTKAKSKDAK